MSIFTIETLESFTPGARPQDEDFENMITRLGKNIVVLHKTFPKDEMTWMVLVHIPTGERVMISFPEDEERLYTPEEMCDILAGKEEGTGSTQVSMPTSSMPTSILGDQELKESLNALIDLGVEAAVREQHPDNATTQPVYRGRYVKGGEK